MTTRARAPGAASSKASSVRVRTCRPARSRYCLGPPAPARDAASRRDDQKDSVARVESSLVSGHFSVPFSVATCRAIFRPRQFGRGRRRRAWSGARFCIAAAKNLSKMRHERFCSSSEHRPENRLRGGACSYWRSRHRRAGVSGAHGGRHRSRACAGWRGDSARRWPFPKWWPATNLHKAPRQAEQRRS